MTLVKTGWLNSVLVGWPTDHPSIPSFDLARINQFLSRSNMLRDSIITGLGRLLFLMKGLKSPIVSSGLLESCDNVFISIADNEMLVDEMNFLRLMDRILIP